MKMVGLCYHPYFKTVSMVMSAGASCFIQEGLVLADLGGYKNMSRSGRPLRHQPSHQSRLVCVRHSVWEMNVGEPLVVDSALNCTIEHHCTRRQQGFHIFRRHRISSSRRYNNAWHIPSSSFKLSQQLDW